MFGVEYGEFERFKCNLSVHSEPVLGRWNCVVCQWRERWVDDGGVAKILDS